MSFWCKKRREQVIEPCSDCDDCPGAQAAEIHAEHVGVKYVE